MYKKNTFKCKQHGPRCWCKLFLTHTVIFIQKRLNPIGTNGFLHAAGSGEKPFEVAGVMTAFCSADLSEVVACWTWLTVTVPPSEGINFSVSVASGLNGHIPDVRKPEMIVFMDIVFSNASLNRIGKSVLLTITPFLFLLSLNVIYIIQHGHFCILNWHFSLVAPCVILANVMKSVMVLKWFFRGL